MNKLAYILTTTLVIALLAATPMVAYGQQNVGQKPVLGWSSWSFIRKHPTAAKIKAQALALHNSGLQQLGYEYVNLDDFWYQCPGNQGPNVDQYGRWVTDSSIFPSQGDADGMKVVANYIHSLGLKFGIYLTPGISKQAVSKNTQIKDTPNTADQIAEPSVAEKNYNCGGMVRINYKKPGAQAYINSWADMLAKWGVDYIKFDGVQNRSTAAIEAWSRAIEQSGRPMILDVTRGSFTNDIALTVMKYANQWEIAPADIEDYRDEKNGSSYPLTDWAHIKNRFNSVADWQPYASPGGYNDYDSIEIGNGENDGLTPAERKTQISLWALASAPLILGVDLTHLNQQELQKYLKNTAVLAVDQDGIAAKRLVKNGDRQVFAKIETNGDAVVGLFNTGQKPVQIAIQASTIGLPENENGYSVKDLWTDDTRNTDGTIRAMIPPHGVVLYRVKDR